MKPSGRFAILTSILAVVLGGAWSATGSSRGRSTDPDRAQWASLMCRRIDLLYSTCGRRFKFDGKNFRFSTALGNRTVSCTDGRELSFYDRMDAFDISSIMMIPYQTGAMTLPEDRRDFDPGRLRSEDLLASIYGGSEDQVRKNLVEVEFLGQHVHFQKQLGAAAALARVGRELTTLAATDSSVEAFLEPFTSGAVDLREMTFNWRDIAGTHRLSAHAFGTAIDLLTDRGPMYWLWDAKKEYPHEAARGELGLRGVHWIPKGPALIPMKVVEVFEKNGFIWGGKWNHYDNMHFEYRPEFIAGAAISCDPTAINAR